MIDHAKNERSIERASLLCLFAAHTYMLSAFALHFYILLRMKQTKAEAHLRELERSPSVKQSENTHMSASERACVRACERVHSTKSRTACLHSDERNIHCTY